MSGWRVSVSVFIILIANVGVSGLAFVEMMGWLIPHPGVWPGNLGVLQNI